MEKITQTISPSKYFIILPPIPIPIPIRSSSCQMNLLPNIPPTTIPLKSSTFPRFQYQPKPAETAAATTCRILGIPARDRVIDFGKHKGKMLGSLPSSYLKWVSKNLRAGDTEEWAKLADQVLTDPVYRDRIEWELAEKILSGNDAASAASSSRSAVAELLETSERFGWDNEDKGGWSKVDFGLLGTSKGGRIPRLAAAAVEESGVEVGSAKKKKKGKVEEVENGEKRRERRERARRRREEGIGEVVAGYGNGEEMDDGNGEDGAVGAGGRGRGSPLFPGREALLNKVLNRQKVIEF